MWASLHNFHSMGPGKGICTGVLKGEGGAGSPRGGCYWQEARCACFSEGQREGSMTERRLFTPLLSCDTGPSCQRLPTAHRQGLLPPISQIRKLRHREGMCSRPHSWLTAEPGLHAGLYGSEAVPLTMRLSVFFPQRADRNLHTPSICSTLSSRPLLPAAGDLSLRIREIKQLAPGHTAGCQGPGSGG